jgi:peptide deformylase
MKLNKINLYKPAGRWSMWDAKSNLDIANEMLRFMRANNGIGLAANQLGMAKRLFVMEVDGIARICFNPSVNVESTELVTMEEGCLSFPGAKVTITRPESVTVSYQKADGDVVAAVLEGMEARCFQHELDHLNGTTMIKRSISQ